MRNNVDRELFDKRKKLIYELVQDDLYVPMKEKELAVFMQVEKEDREEFRKVLSELLSESKISVTSKGKYMKADENIVTGTFVSNARGFGFVEIEGRDEDLFIPDTKTGGAFHQDTVQVKILPGQRGKRQEAEIIKVISHGTTQIVGTYQKSKSFGFVVPDNLKLSSDIFISKERSKGAVDGHKVVVEITNYGSDDKKPEGKVVEILGHINDPGVDILSIVRNFDLPMEFSEKVLQQAERVSGEVTEADRQGREDLRNVQMVTIDGEDAKDLDDAISVSKEGEDYLLGVHIADVTNYVDRKSVV